jgi:hypothetical protein
MDAIDAARKGYADSLLNSAVQGMPPGYIAGFKITLNQDMTVTMGAGIAMVSGIKVELDDDKDLTGGMETFKRLGAMWAYIYIGRDGLYHVDTVIPGFYAKYAANYHPRNPWRYLGRMWIDSAGVNRFAQAGGFT